MTAAAMLARRQLRLAALPALQALTGVTVDCPPVLSTPPKKMPYVGLRCGTERKAGPVTQQLATFTTTVPLEIIARVSATTKEAAQDEIEALAYRIEQAVLSLVTLTALVQKIAGVTTTTEISGEGSAFQAGIEMIVDCEVFEEFDPTVINADNYPRLEGVNVHVDAGRPFDATGDYPDAPFPDAVPPAPRTSGPDGRDEGSLVIDFPA